MLDQLPVAQAATTNLRVAFAQSESEVFEAQRLRYAVFAEECGAKLAGAIEGVDRDRFDPHCNHLLVRDVETNKVVGTCRILPAKQVEKIKGFYSETEFDLTRIRSLMPRLVEVERSCIHRDYRRGAVISLLWAALAQYMWSHGYEYLMECASISLANGGAPSGRDLRRTQRDLPEPGRVAGLSSPSMAIGISQPGL